MHILYARSISVVITLTSSNFEVLSRDAFTSSVPGTKVIAVTGDGEVRRARGDCAWAPPA